MLGWVLIICLPLPFIAFMINPKLLEDLDPDKDKPDCEDPLIDTTKKTTNNNNDPNQQTPILTSQPQFSLRDYLFRTRNSILQFILAGILYGGFGIYFWSGYQYLPEGSIERPLSIFTVVISMITFILATTSSPAGLYSPIHKHYTPDELKSNSIDCTKPISNDIVDAVNERFDVYWYQYNGQYKYDNTIFYQNAWCSSCEQPKLARSTHCSLCGHCIPRQDHHCWWLNTCVGAGNYHIFYILLLAKSWLTTYGSYIMWLVFRNISISYNLDEILTTYLTNNGYTEWYHLSWFTFQFYKHQFLATKFPILWVFLCLIWFLALPVVGFTIYHTRLILCNITTNEDTKRTYVLNWLKATQLPQLIDEQIHKHDVELLRLQTEDERNQYAQDNYKGCITPSTTTTTTPNANNTNDTKSLDDEVVGCVGTTTLSSKSNTATKVSNNNNNEDEVVGCVGPTSIKSTSNDCSSCDKHNQNKKLPRIPFQNILYPSTAPQYQQTQDEKYFESIIKLQQRPIGNQGWFEPPVSPYILPLKENEQQQSSQLRTALPEPQYWTREYFSHAVNHNIYDMGSIWLNIKDAFGFANKNDYSNFIEYDLQTLLQLRSDWNKQQIVQDESKKEK